MTAPIPKKSLVYIDEWSVPLGGEDGFVRMRHAKKPGLRFVITYSSNAEVTGFMVVRDADDSPRITARELQRVPYGALERAALDKASSWILSYTKGQSPSLDAAGGSVLDQVARAFTDTPYPGGQGRSLAWYAAVARRYVELVGSGSTSPIKALAGEMALSENKVRNIIFECREKSLLTSASKRGVAGGELTKTALDLLRQDEGSK